MQYFLFSLFLEMLYFANNYNKLAYYFAKNNYITCTDSWYDYVRCTDSLYNFFWMVWSAYLCRCLWCWRCSFYDFMVHLNTWWAMWIYLLLLLLWLLQCYGGHALGSQQRMAGTTCISEEFYHCWLMLCVLVHFVRVFVFACWCV